MRLLFALVGTRWYVGKIAAGPVRLSGDARGWTIQDPALIDYLTLPGMSPMGQQAILGWIQVQLLGPDELHLPGDSVTAWAYDDLAENGAAPASKPAELYRQALSTKKPILT